MADQTSITAPADTDPAVLDLAKALGVSLEIAKSIAASSDANDKQLPDGSILTV